MSNPALFHSSATPARTGRWLARALVWACWVVPVPQALAAESLAPGVLRSIPEGDPSSTAVPSGYTLPQVLESVPAEHPPEELDSEREAHCELFVTVKVDGSVGEVSVARSGGPAFDFAAMTAVRKWRFIPAHHGDQAVPSRIRVPFHFHGAPAPDNEEGALSHPAAPAAEARPPSSPSQSTAAASPLEVTVFGQRQVRAERRSSGDFQVNAEVLSAAPRQEGAEVLRAAPGVYIGRGEGGAVAHNYMLRGFDADHGQDIEFHVGGIPINLPSHIHGQGYSDLGFLVADAVGEMQVTEGVYDPRQGDFAVAGSIDLKLAVADRERGVKLRSSVGSWNTQRHQMIWAPPGASNESFGAAQYSSTNGFGEGRAGQSASAIVQHRFGDRENDQDGVTFRAVGWLHAARSNLAGVVRQDDVQAGRVCFTCVYPYPTAREQNALANRLAVGLFADYEGYDGDNGQLGIWLSEDNFRSQQNFTGFIEQSRLLERVGGRGDLIEQLNHTTSVGLTGRYRSAPFAPLSWASGTVELGVDARLDKVNQAQNLLDASARNQTWDRRVDTTLQGSDLGLWGDLDWALGAHLRARAGLRADVLSYAIDDRLGNFAPLTRPQDNFIVGFRRSALGLAWGPRTSLEWQPIAGLQLLAAYGEGYRSPQARLLEDGEQAPFSKVRSLDTGLRAHLGSWLELTLSGFYTRLSDDVAFEASEGRLERIGATQRLGATAYALSHPTDDIVAALSVTAVDATLLQPPAATADEPQPPFEVGQRLPFVPPVVVRADLGADRLLVESLAGQPLDGTAGIGFSWLSNRPLPYSQYAPPVATVDAALKLTWGPLQLAVEAFNLTNSRYAAVEYSFPSDWAPDDGVRPRTPARHTAAGSPRTWMFSIGVTP